MKMEAVELDKTPYIRITVDKYGEEIYDWPAINKAVLLALQANPGITILGFERAYNGNHHDSDAVIELTEIGCEHTEWFEFQEKSKYVSNTGWAGPHITRKVVESIADIDLDKWAEVYDEEANGEARYRHVLACDNSSGEIFMYRY